MQEQVCNVRRLCVGFGVMGWCRGMLYAVWWQLCGGSHSLPAQCMDKHIVPAACHWFYCSHVTLLHLLLLIPIQWAFSSHRCMAILFPIILISLLIHSMIHMHYISAIWLRSMDLHAPRISPHPDRHPHWVVFGNVENVAADAMVMDKYTVTAHPQ